MMIIDPVTLGDVSCTRASVKYVYDRTGTLVQVPANTLAVTYDPSDLTKAPYALVEAASKNCIPNNTMVGGAANGAAPTGWVVTFTNNGVTRTVSALGTENGIDYVDIAFSGTATTRAWFWINTIGNAVQPAAAGQAWCGSMFAKVVSGTKPSQLYCLISGRNSGGFAVEDSAQVEIPTAGALSACRITNSLALTSASSVFVSQFITVMVEAGETANLTIRIGLPQLELSGVTSPIRTTTAPVTRAADTIAPGAGLVYSNVAINETPYSSASTYAQGAQVYDPATYLMYQSLIANNVGHPLTEIASWTPMLKVVNQRLMLDQYNNTQTNNTEEIIIVLSPQAIAQGLYLGNVDASEIRISVVDPTDGLVYQEAQSLVVSNSASSYFNWFFKRIKRKSYAVSVLLPPYFNALVTIAIKKLGGTPKCGMCVLGALVDIGLSQYGLSREIKDYSTVNFNFDGTSNVVKRNFAKIMDVDVILENDQIDSVIETLEGYRQKPLVWIGAVQYGSACLFGTYTSFKNIVSYPNESTMNLQIQGTV